MKILTVIGIICSILFVSCASSSPQNDTSENPLQGTWELVQMASPTDQTEMGQTKRFNQSSFRTEYSRGYHSGSFRINDGIYTESYSSSSDPSMVSSSTRWRIRFNGENEFTIVFFSNPARTETYRRVE